MPARVPDQTGVAYGRLTVAEDGKRVGRIVTVICDCGSRFDVTLRAIRSGDTKSCGCLKVDVSRQSLTTHGMSGTPIHAAWQGMKARCNAPSAIAQSPNYANVSVCEEWQTFEGFLANPPDGEFVPRVSVLGRYGDTGDYSPTNARWITKAENTREAKVKHFLDGEPAIDVARRNGLTNAVMRDRLKIGWTLRDAATLPRQTTWSRHPKKSRETA